ncbi:hypothetical protein HK102_009627, partial [Quaeritorhiza haematococci]
MATRTSTTAAAFAAHVQRQSMMSSAPLLSAQPLSTTHMTTFMPGRCLSHTTQPASQLGIRSGSPSFVGGISSGLHAASTRIPTSVRSFYTFHVPKDTPRIELDDG